MTTKKELQERYEISLNTVRKTLAACGLDTSREEYTEAEINQRFDVARRMLAEEQRSYQEVANHFGATVSEEDRETDAEPANGSRPRSGSSQLDPLAASIRGNVEDYVQEVTDEAVNEVITHLPQMIYESAQKAVNSGAVDRVFQNMLEQRRASGNYYDSNGEVVEVAAQGLPFVEDDEDTER